jgi:hypothetical protein
MKNVFLRKVDLTVINADTITQGTRIPVYVVGMLFLKVGKFVFIVKKSEHL